MRIDGYGQIGRVQGVRFRGFDGLDGVAAPGSDSLQISSNAEDFRAALDALKEVPDVREEKVAELRQSLEQGSFDLSLDKLAEKLLP